MEDNETPTTEGNGGKRKRKRDVLFEGFKDVVPPPVTDDIPDDVGPEVPDGLLADAITPPPPPPPPPESPRPPEVKTQEHDLEPDLSLQDPPTKPSLVPLPRQSASSPRLRRHDDDSIGTPLERRDGSPPPTAIPIQLGRRRPAPYEPAFRQPSPGMVDESPPLPAAQVRTSLPTTEYTGRSKKTGDPVVNAIEEAFAGFGPEEHVVDIKVDVLDEATRQFWTIGKALNQPISIAREPSGYLHYGGYYRVTVAPAGENFPPRRSRHFTARIKGPPRPLNWFFDESDIGGAIYGERGGGEPMGWASQPVTPPASGTDPDNVLRTIRTMREIEKEFKKPEGEDDVRRKLEDLESEVRTPRWRQNPWDANAMPPMYGAGMRRDEERRREEDERRRAEAAERKAELSEMQRRYDVQMEELRRQRESDQQKWELERKAREDAERKATERERDLQAQQQRTEERRLWDEQRREERDRWEQQQRAEKERLELQQRENERRREEDMRRFEMQFSELKKQNELLNLKLLETPKETSMDKLMTLLPQLWTNAKSEQLAAEQRWREESRQARDREREDSQRQMIMMQELSRQNNESVRAQAIQAQEHSRTLLDFATRENKSDSFASLGSVLSTLMQVQTNALSSVTQMQQGNTPSPWMDVAAGIVEAVGDVAKSVIAAKFGGDPSALAGMLPGMPPQGMPAASPPVRRPPPAPAPRQPPTQQPPVRQAAPPPNAPVAIPRRAPRAQAQPSGEPAPGIPRRIVARILDAAKAGEDPLKLARRVFAMVELCEVNALAEGNPQSEEILRNLMTEGTAKQQLAELFSAVEVTDEEYVEAVFKAYMTLVYAYANVVQGAPGGDDEDEDEDEDEAPPGETPPVGDEAATDEPPQDEPPQDEPPQDESVAAMAATSETTDEPPELESAEVIKPPVRRRR